MSSHSVRPATEDQTATVFLKLGGSLITKKSSRHTARPETITRVATEIGQAILDRPNLRLVIGHGAGSFGHYDALRYGTQDGVTSSDGWRRFARIASATTRLNHIVFDALESVGLPIIRWQPSASAICEDGNITSLATPTIKAAVHHGLVPLVHGDVAFDTVRGGTILSTEVIFRYLAMFLRPKTILLAGLDQGVLEGYPHGKTVGVITPRNYSSISIALKPPSSPDVTGGMDTKVSEMLSIVKTQPKLQVRIFSADQPGVLRDALLENNITCTTIRNQ